MEPNIVRGQSEDTYHRDTTTLSASGAKVLLGKRPPAEDPDAIVAGGSIGAVFAASGWQVHKRNLSYTEVPATAKLASLMRIGVGTPLAEHVYALDVAKNGRTIEYASIVEIHHPSYLRVVDLVKIYGSVDAEQSRAPSVSALRALAEQRAR